MGIFLDLLQKLHFSEMTKTLIESEIGQNVGLWGF